LIREKLNIKTLTSVILLISIPLVGFAIFQLSNTSDNSPYDITIGCYNGNGVLPEEIPILSHFSKWLGCNFITLQGTDIVSGALDDIDVLILPGGNGAVYWNDIGSEGKTKILEFVDQGGGYLGICEGAYRACEYAVWMDDPNHPAPNYLVLDSKKFLGLIPGVAWGPVFEIAERPDPGWGMAVIDIVNRTHQITDEAPEKMTMFYMGGCYIELASNDSATILGNYNVTGKAAILACEYGQGRVFVSGTHPEIEESSDRDGCQYPNPEDEPTDPESDWPLLREAVKWLLRDPVNWLSKNDDTQFVQNASNRIIVAYAILMHALDVKQQV
jgi:glutamine amidotransferase-like uncharacterized protein